MVIKKKIDSEAGFKLEVQCQLEVSFPPDAAQLILINVIFFWIISLVFHVALLKLISDSLCSGFKLSYLGCNSNETKKGFG